MSENGKEHLPQPQQQHQPPFGSASPRWISLLKKKRFQAVRGFAEKTERERGGKPFLHIFKTLQSYIIINFIKIFKEKTSHQQHTNTHTLSN